MQLLRSTGISQYAEIDPSTMVDLAMSGLSDNEILQASVDMADVRAVNEMIDNLSNWHKPAQQAHYNQLPEEMKSRLSEQGYVPPDDREGSKAGFWKRTLWPGYWDDNVHDLVGAAPYVGDALAAGTRAAWFLPSKALYFGVNRPVAGLWKGLEAVGRNSQRMSRTYLRMREDGFTLNPVTFLRDPKRAARANLTALDAWRSVENEGSSFTREAEEEARDILNDDRLYEIAQLTFRHKGVEAGAWEFFAAQGEAEGLSPEDPKIYDRWLDFLTTMEEEVPRWDDAIQVLTDNTVDPVSWSIRKYDSATDNLRHLGGPGSWTADLAQRDGIISPHTVIALGAALVGEMAFDPTTYSPFIVKSIKNAAKVSLKAGMSGGDVLKSVDLMHRITATSRAIKLLETGSDLTPALKATLARPGQGQILGPVTHAKLSETIVELSGWAADHGVNWLGQTSGFLLRAGNRSNAYIDRVTDAFAKYDRWILERTKILAARPGLSDRQLEAAVLEALRVEGITAEPLTALVNDLPELGTLIESMRGWHIQQRNYMTELLDSKGARMTLRKKGLSEFDGYWEFLSEVEGQRALFTGMGGHNTGGIFFPETTWKNVVRMRTKSWATGFLAKGEKSFFDAAGDVIKADIGELSGEFLAARESILLDALERRFGPTGSLSLSRTFSRDELSRVLAGDKKALETFQISDEDFNAIIEVARDLAPTMAKRVKDSGLVDDFFIFHEGAHGVTKFDDASLLAAAPRRRGLFRHGRNFTETLRHNLHRPGSMNAEASWIDKALAPVATRSELASSILFEAMYHPVNFARKFTVHVPKSTVLDVTDTKTAVAEFKAAVEMGLMADMPREVINSYLTAFTYGTSAQRWDVATKFFLDFMGRSGMLVHGGKNVDEWVKKFIAQSDYTYSNIGLDFHSISNVKTKRALIAGEANAGQISKMNVIPHWGEMAKAARYMSIYRYLGHILGASQIDQIFRKFWKPAVLMRVGVAIRNGADEALGFVLREGPLAYTNSKLARIAQNSAKTWDEYGRPLWINLDDADDAQSAARSSGISHGARIPLEVRRALLIKPFTRIMRTVNDWTGVGDFAVTRKAIKKAMDDTGHSWALMRADEQQAAIKTARDSLMADMGPRGQLQRGLFDFADGISQRSAYYMHEIAVTTRLPGARPSVARSLLEMQGESAIQLAKAKAIQMTNPTLMQASHEKVFGAYKTYYGGTSGDRLDEHIRSLGFGKSGDVLPYIPLDYASSEVRWISKGMDVHQATPVDILDAADYQIRLHADAPESIAAVRELSHYIDPGTESYFQDLIQRTLRVPSQTIGEKGTTASRHALEIFRKATDVDEFSPSFLLHLRRAAAEALPDGKFRVAIHGYTDWDSGSSALVEKIRDVYGDGPAEFIHDLLFRTDLGGNHLGQQPLAFLLNSSIDSSRLSADAASIEKRMQIAHRAVLAEPDSYQRVQSLSRIGGSEPNAVRTMPPATPQEIRLFFPVLPVEGEHIKILTHILSGGAATKDYLKAIRAGIETEFIKVGIPASQVDIFLKNLHPHSNPMGSPGVTGADALQQLAISYGQARTLGGPYFPLPVGSANPMVAEAISRGWDRAMDTILGGATRSPKRAVNAETSTPRVMARLFGRDEYDATSGFGKFYGSRTGHTIERAGVKSRHEAVPKRIYLQGDSSWGSDIEIPPGFVRFENAAGEPILSASGSVQFIHPSNLVDTSKGPASLGEALVDVARQPAEDALSLSVTAQEERLALLHGLENLADESVVMVPAYTTQQVAVSTKVNEKLKVEHPFASARQSLVREKHRVWTPRKLKDNQVIVFSSDIDGRHEKAARIVMDSGAVRGQGRGRQGQSYAITTWDPARSGPAEGYTVGNTGTYVKGGAAKPNSNYVNSIYGTVVPTKRSMTGDEIHEQLLELVEHAKENPETEFLLTPIGVGPGKGNFTYENINELIEDIEFPDNVIKTWYSKELEETGDLPPRFIDITRTKTTAGGPSVTAAAPGKGDEFTRTVMDLVEALNDGATDEQIAAILGLPVELVERISTGKRSLLVEQVAPLDNAPDTVPIAHPYSVQTGDEKAVYEMTRWERAGLSEKPPRYKGALEGVDKDGDPVRFIDDDPDFLRRIGLSPKEVENGAWVKIHKKDTLGALTPRQSKRALRGVDVTGEAGLRENVYLATGNIKVQGKVIKPKPRPGRRTETVTTVTRKDVPGGEVDQVWLRNYRLQKLTEMHAAGDIDEVVVFDRGTAFEGTDPGPALSGPGVHPDMVGARLATTPTKFRSDPELQRFAEKHGTLRDREGFVSPEKKRVRHRMQTVGDTGHARTFHTWDPDLQMPVTPRDVGGFGDRLIVGVAPGQMSGNGVDVIHTLNDSPQVAIQRLYKEKSTGNYTWSRAGAPEDLERYKNTDDWELVDEQYTSLSDMEDSIKTLSIESTRELVNLLSTLKGKPTVRSASKGATTPVKPKIAVGRKGVRGDAGRPPVADEALDTPPELGAPRIENAPSEDPLIGALEVPAEINVAGETVVKYSTGENQILSNLQEAPFEFRGVTYRTAEGAYQDWKTGQRLSSLSSKEEAVLEAQRVLALQAEAFGDPLPEDPIEALKALARFAESNDPSALFPVEYLDELIERLEEVPLAAGAAAVPDEAANLIKVSESLTFPHSVDDNLSLEEIHSAIEDSETISTPLADPGSLDDFKSTDLKDLLTAEEFANRFENPTATIDALIEFYKDVIAEWDPKDARFVKNVSDRRHFGESFVEDLIADPSLELLADDTMLSRLIDARASLAKRFPDRQLNLFGQEVAADGARVLPDVRETTNFPEMAGATARRQGAGRSPKIEGDANVDLMREILEAKYDQVREFQIALDSAGTITHPVQDEFWANKFPELLESLKEGKKPEVKPRGMRKTKVLTVERVRENPKSAYLFADSLSGKGKRGQAVIRDEPNAFGIPVKKTYSGRLMHFSDDDFVTNKEAIDAAFDAIPDDMDVVVPSAGLGSGAAKLEEKAPKTFAYIESKIEELRLIKPAPVAEVSKIKEARLPTPFADKAAEVAKKAPTTEPAQAASGVAQPTVATSPEMRSTLSPSETRVNHAWTLELAPLPHGEVVPNAHQIHAYADMSLVPDGLVMRVPVAAKKTIGDRITNTFGAFFEGVMSPIVGALAREPMFDYYFAKALEITRPFRNYFNHEPKAFDSFFAFDDGLAIGARKLDDGQVVIEDLEDYIMFDMPNKTIDPDSKETALGDLLEARRHAHDPYDKSLKEFLRVELTDAFVEGGPGTPDDVENIIGQVPMVSGRFSDVFPEMDSVFIKMFEEDPDQLDLVIKQLMDYMNFKFTQNQAHVDVAAERALHQTSLFIDDHNLRSQFQESVGSLIPFWFAEDQFLRRWARTMQENPAALRQLQVGLNASTRAGLITEDSEGNRRLIIPGTEMFVKMVFEVLGEIPVIRDYFGADVGYVGGDLSLGLNTILPGYDLDTVGQLGFGPLLSMPILAASQRDPSLRGEGLWGFGDNMVSRFGYDQSAGELMWSSVMPLPLSRTAAIAFGWQMPMSEGRIKAETDAIMLMALNESLPTEEDLVTAENPDLLAEDVYRNVEHLGRQLQLLQYGSWFFGPGSASPIDLYADPAFEWNERFQVLRDRGVPFEEAFSYWRKEYQEEWFKELAESKELPVSYMNSVSTYRDKGFDLLPAIAAADRDLRAKGFEPTVRLREEWMREELKLSVFRQGKTTKTSIAAQWQTEAAHEWTLENRDWVSAYPYAAPFFIPRGSSIEDTEYSSEARSLQVAMQLREVKGPEEFIRSVYTSAASIPYYQQSLEHQRRLAAYRSRGANAEIEYENKIWDEWKNSYLRSHPVFHNTMFSQDSKARRTQTVDQFRLILADEKVPEGEYRDDVLAGMALVVGFEDRMDRLFGLTSGAARDKRNKVRFEYNTRFNELIKNRPWLYEMYYNLFVPLISEAWIVKLEAGQYDDLGIYA
jgi:hypothetical protein